MALENVRDLDLVFGPESAGKTARERAQTSTRLFVRSQVQLAEDSPEAKGHRLSAWEALQTFGLPKLLEVFEHGSAILSSAVDEPARTLRNRRESLGLPVKKVASAAGLSEKEVEDAENPKTLTSIHIIEKIAQTLALDERAVSFVPGANGDPRLACKTERYGNNSVQFCISVSIVRGRMGR